MACTPSHFQKGMKIWQEGRLSAIREDMDAQNHTISIGADVNRQYTQGHHAVVWYDYEKQEIEDFECTCSEGWKQDKMCSHCVAVALEISEDEEEAAKRRLEELLSGVRASQQERHKSRKSWTSPGISRMIYQISMDEKARFLQPGIAGKVELIPFLHLSSSGYFLEFKIGVDTPYVIKDVSSFLRSVRKREKVDYGKRLGFIHDIHTFTEESRRIIDFLQRHGKEEDLKSTHIHGGRSWSCKEVPLSEGEMGEFLHLMVGSWCQIKDDNYGGRRVFVQQGEPKISTKLQKSKNKKDYELLLPPVQKIYGNPYIYIIQSDIIYECGVDFSTQMGELLQMGQKNSITQLYIDEKDMGAFCTTILPLLETYTQMEVEGSLEEYYPKEVQIKIYLDNPYGLFTARLEAWYEEESYNILEELKISEVFRDTKAEHLAAQTAGAYFEGITQDREYYLSEKKEDKVYQLLTMGIAQLQQVGEVYISDTLKKVKVVSSAKIGVGTSLTGDLLELSMDLDWLSAKEVQQVLESYRMKKKFHRLKNGDFMELDGDSIKTLAEVVEGLGLSTQDLQEDFVTLPKYRAFYLDQVMKDSTIKSTSNGEFQSFIQKMNGLEESEFEIPPSLKEVLRNYQKIGYQWLCTLDTMGFGGILADDMGLGKTIQMISFLLFKKEQNENKEKKPSLIVCPASLVYNWESEIQRFAPGLSVLTVAGNAEERAKQLEHGEAWDIIITSYDLLRRDLEMYKKISFYTQILDEAQYIKNHNTQVSKAVRKIKSTTRFALTGTPIENRLSELWSIFDYLMPGFLDTYRNFKTMYEVPIIAARESGDTYAIKQLQRMIRPFILRRLKKDVLKELPEKEEQVVYTKLEGEQLDLYRANVQKMLDDVSEQSEEEFSGGKIEILSQLTRLRQICCAPELVYQGYTGEAAKVETCMELLRSAVESGQKVLLFSQFTSVFAILEKRLKKEKMEFYKLTGATPKEQRVRMAEEFNKNEVPVFLISLKAGGTGLNLTGANIVIHFDPWWNMAAQNQATDRAHRIGQEEKVTVLKLIAKNTIEEKILKLQEAKKDLSDQVIMGEGIDNGRLTKEDFLGILS